MRVAQVKEFGGPEVLVTAEVPDPLAGPGEAVVAVSAVDTIFVETQVRSGAFGEHFAVQPPYVPGGGIAGTVRAVGQGVDKAWIGRRVITALGFTGGYAEQAVAPVAKLVPVPDGLGLQEAAALVHDGVTACALLESTGLGAGERVLILGASGGMGTLLVQLAKAAGAEVTGVARGERKTSLVRELGANVVVDATRDDWVAQTRAALGPAGADVVLDGVGGAPGLAAFALTADGGIFSAHGAPTGGFAPVDAAEAERRAIKLLGIGDVQLSDEEYVRLAAKALEEAAAGRLRPVIGGTFPLTRAAEAHAAIEARTLRGKVLLTM
ncbi:MULTISPECIES: zinc-binding dehydrogenase [unclassified Streptomyces]|uniref:zinc-binding dehydrogenase n=1 Tax=unclassified Streptomyces TaxID=2593676 RepID=UPI002DD86A9F|nr:zinc-binding dehydrogenase [Streptomyces sp. NBC_01750]WSB01967.1 zinc-binding dehydrogenase [Streptomyces sp. NBC_01794]WSD33765.1 zinc-binding dehydrogenase [Streptomyces sp. NBC_01750]